jgi:hypothetical protein
MGRHKSVTCWPLVPTIEKVIRPHIDQSRLRCYISQLIVERVSVACAPGFRTPVLA